MAASAVVEPAPLDRAIDDVLAGSNFRWRLRPPAVRAAKETDGPIRSFFRLAGEKIRDFWRMLWRLWRNLTDWYDRHFPGHAPEEKPKPAAASSLPQDLLRGLLYIFIGVAVLLLGWLGLIVSAAGPPAKNSRSVLDRARSQTAQAGSAR